MNWLEGIILASALPRNIPVRDIIPILNQLGFFEKSTKGRHRIFVKPGHPSNIALPVSNRDVVHIGTLGQIIRRIGISPQQFVSML